LIPRYAKRQSAKAHNLTFRMTGTEETSSKRKRDSGVEKEENKHGWEKKRIKKAKKPRRSSAAPKTPYSKDDFEKYMQDGRMEWDKVLESFNFHVELLRGKQAPPPHSTEVFEFESDAGKSSYVRYVIQPGAVWKTMSRYRKFTSTSLHAQHLALSNLSADP